MVKEKKAYFCEEPGCDFHSFSKPEVEKHERIPVKKDKISGLVLLNSFEKIYTVVRINGKLNTAHELLYTWDRYKESKLNEIDSSNIIKKIDKLFSNRNIVPSRGLEEQVVKDSLMGDRSRNTYLESKEFKKVTDQLRELYPERYPDYFKFRRTIGKNPKMKEGYVCKIPMTIRSFC